MPKKIKILLSGGGTGGHLYPLITVAETLMHEAAPLGPVDMRYYGDPGAYRGALEARGIRVVHITSSKLRNYFSVQNIFDAFRLIWSIPQALSKIFFFMPHVAFTKGGPGTLPIILACRFYAIPTVVHESDTIPGRTTRAAARSARIVDLGFQGTETQFSKTKAVFHVTGNPIRPEIAAVRNFSAADRAASKIEFGLSPDRPVLLIVGGSQGADRLNMFVLEHLAELLQEFQILHQTGIGNYESYKKEYDFVAKPMDREALSRQYKFFPFFDAGAMAKAYAAADIMLSRAGASAIFEAAATGTPAIFVPLPEAAQNHQFQNAYHYRERGAGLCIEEDNFLISVFLNEATKLIKNPERLNAMREAARAFYTEGAAEKIAADVLSLIFGQKATS
jgi:UDP-N-acetylglucosamine--N-acetylmuramyl-(pentapeptide) pyrophosphoryl-undecaprenol N-acetylglucosamine transferase